MTQKR